MKGESRKLAGWAERRREGGNGRERETVRNSKRQRGAEGEEGEEGERLYLLTPSPGLSVRSETKRCVARCGRKGTRR